MADGKLLFRALSYFRDVEDGGVRGDPLEGSASYRPDGGLVMTNHTQGTVQTLVGHAVHSMATQAQRRFNVVRLPNLDLEKDGEMLESAIATYCSFAVETMHKETDLVVARLIHASYHQVGTALEIAQKAVALARVRARGKLNLEDFAAVYERMTSSVRSANPFVVEGWDRIDIGVIAPRSAAEATIKAKGRK